MLDHFRFAYEDLDDVTYRRASYSSIWMNVPERGQMKLNVGTNYTTFGIATNEPTGGDNYTGVWSAINLTSPHLDGEATTLCANNWADVYWGAYELAYHPEQSQLRGPEICERQLLFSHNIDDFLKGYISEMTKRVRRQWEHCYAYHHRRLSFKCIAGADIEGSIYEQEALTGLPAATSEITQEMLEFLAARMIEEGATEPDGNGFITLTENGPTFGMYIGMIESQWLLRQNASIREDYRHGDPSLLTKRIGATRVIGNFRHMVNQRPARFTWAPTGNGLGTYTQVPAYIVDTDVSMGTGYEINPEWRTAPYEGIDLITSGLFTSEVPAAKTSAGGVQLGPINYNGDWDFKVGAYRWRTSITSGCEDPQDQIGRHFGSFMHAVKPNPLGRFKLGGFIIAQRCTGNKLDTVTCSS